MFTDWKFELFRDGPLEKLWGRGEGNFRAHEFFFVIKFLVWIFLGHSMNIFLGLIGVHNFFFHLIFPCANIFFVLRPHPHKFSNGPSLSIINANLFSIITSGIYYVYESIFVIYWLSHSLATSRPLILKVRESERSELQCMRPRSDRASGEVSRLEWHN